MTPLWRQRLLKGAILLVLAVGAGIGLVGVPFDVEIARGTLAEVQVDGKRRLAFSRHGWPPPSGSRLVGSAMPSAGRTDTGIPVTMEEGYPPSLGRILDVRGPDRFVPGSDRIIYPNGEERASLTVLQILRYENGTEHIASLFRDGLERHPILSPVIFVAIFTLGTVVLFPATILTIIGALAFGRLWGSVYVMLGMDLGACAAFLVARWIGRGAVERFLPEKILTLSGKLDRSGFWAILLLRLIPVCPYNLLNYACGITRMRFLSYVAGGTLGMLPVMVLWVQATLSVAEMQLSRPLGWIPMVILAALVLAPLLLLRLGWSGPGVKKTPGTG